MTFSISIGKIELKEAVDTITMSSAFQSKLLFFGAGNIAQSMIRGILRKDPHAAQRILATAPSHRNLDIVSEKLNCRTSLISDLSQERIREFGPDYVLLCMKPQSFLASTDAQSGHFSALSNLMSSISKECRILSLIAGLKIDDQARALSVDQANIVRVMLNTAASINLTSVLYHHRHHQQEQKSINHNNEELKKFLSLIGEPVVELSDEKLMDVATGLCGSGIAFFYEMIQVMADLGVRNGLARKDAISVAAQLSRAAGEMVQSYGEHPYKLRDDVSSPAGTTIFGLSKWHEESTNQKISLAVQASIDRACQLSEHSN